MSSYIDSDDVSLMVGHEPAAGNGEMTERTRDTRETIQYND
jgi:hypothetical protein